MHNDCFYSFFYCIACEIDISNIYTCKTVISLHMIYACMIEYIYNVRVRQNIERKMNGNKYES